MKVLRKAVLLLAGILLIEGAVSAQFDPTVCVAHDEELCDILQPDLPIVLIVGIAVIAAAVMLYSYITGK